MLFERREQIVYGLMREDDVRATLHDITEITTVR
jgi:hypothetical protein